MEIMLKTSEIKELVITSEDELNQLKSIEINKMLDFLKELKRVLDVTEAISIGTFTVKYQIEGKYMKVLRDKGIIEKRKSGKAPEWFWITPINPNEHMASAILEEAKNDLWHVEIQSLPKLDPFEGDEEEEPNYEYFIGEENEDFEIITKYLKSVRENYFRYCEKIGTCSMDKVELTTDLIKNYNETFKEYILSDAFNFHLTNSEKNSFLQSYNSIVTNDANYYDLNFTRWIFIISKIRTYSVNSFYKGS